MLKSRPLQPMDGSRRMAIYLATNRRNGHRNAITPRQMRRAQIKYNRTLRGQS